MYTLMIVDDEPLAQVGVKSMLDWQALGVSIVGASPNGVHAFEAIERLAPDIVITDIKMPLLDGLGLIERCQAEMEDPPAFIVLTAYADFENARRSLRSQAVDFLVKIELDEAALRSSVERAMAAVDAKRKTRGASGERQGRNVPGPFALSRFLSGEYSDAEEARRSFVQEGLSMIAGPCCAAYVEVGFPFPERMEDQDRSRAYRCAKDMTVELAKREASVMDGDSGDWAFAIAMSFDASEADASRKARAVLDGASEMVGKYFGLRLAIGVGPGASGVEGLPESFRAARAFARLGTAALPEAAESAKSAQTGSQEGAERRIRVAKAVARLSSADFRAEADGVLRSLAQGGRTKAEALESCCDILYPALERLENGQAFIDSLYPGEENGYRCVFSAPSPQAMLPWLEALASGVAARLDALRARGNNPLAASVRCYVLRNYSGKLALADVAKAFRVSPNHLSTVFKKYSGVGFNEFVAKVKVEKAKELLLRGGRKMFEIAQILGFEDAFYFSKVFKRITGLSPREFCLRGAEGRESADDGASGGAP